MYFYRARYWDPQLKIWWSEDPIGLAGGMNNRAGVNGNPITNSDPLGLAPPSTANFSKVPILPPGPLNTQAGEPGYQLPPKPSPELLIPQSCEAKCNLVVGLTCGPITSLVGATGEGLLAITYVYSVCRAEVFGACKAACGLKEFMCRPPL